MKTSDQQPMHKQYSIADSDQQQALKAYRSEAVKSGRGAVWGGVVFGSIFLLSGLGSWLLMTVEALQGSSIDWRQLLFALVFLLLFGGAGSGIVFWSLAQRSKGIFNPQAITQRLQQGLLSQEKSQHKLFYFLGAPFVLLSLPAIIGAISDRQWQGLVALLFTAVGIIVILVGRAKKRAYERIGQTPLTLSAEFPQLGKPLRFRFYLPPNLVQAPQSLALRLNCQHTYSSGSGDNRTTHTDVLWQSKTQAYIQQAKDGRYDIRGQFDLPLDQPVTDAAGYKGTISWELRCQGQLLFVSGSGATGTAGRIKEQFEFKRHWQLPVYAPQDAQALAQILSLNIAGDDPATENNQVNSGRAAAAMAASANISASASSHGVTESIDIPEAHHLQQAEASHQQAKESARQQITSEHDTSRERLYMLSDSKRLRSSGWMGTLFGGVFASVGAFLLYRAAIDGGMLWLMAAIFTFVGGLIFAISVFLLGRKLEMWLDASQPGKAQVKIVRSLFGRRLYQRQGLISDIEQLSLKRTLSSQDQSGDKTEYFCIQLRLKDKTLPLVEGIEGRDAGELLLARLTQLVKHSLLNEQQRARARTLDQNLNQQLDGELR